MLFQKIKLYDFDGEAYIFLGSHSLKRRQGVRELVIPKEYVLQSSTGRFLAEPDWLLWWWHKKEPFVVCWNIDHKSVRNTFRMDRCIIIQTGGY